MAAPSTAEFVAGLYRSILERPADDGGYNYWVRAIDAGLHTQASALTQFVSMPEAQKKIQVRISKMYLQELGRAPDQAGMAWYMEQISTGQLYPSELGLSQSLQQSAEYATYQEEQAKIPASRPGSVAVEYHPDAIGTDGNPNDPITQPLNPSAQEPAITPVVTNRNVSFEISNILSRYGLESMADFVRQLIIDGAEADEVKLKIYEHQAFKDRFPARELMAADGMAPMSPEEYINYETSAAAYMRAGGFPPQFYDDPSDFTQLLANRVSLGEVAARVEDVFVRVNNAPESVRQQYASFYGAQGDIALAMTFLDPDKSLPILEQQVRAAEIGGFGTTFGGVNVGQQRAELLAQAGFDGGSTLSSFNQLREQDALFTESIGETEDLTADEEGVNAAFGLDDDSADTLQRRAASRRNNLGGGGGLNISQEGIAGRADT